MLGVRKVLRDQYFLSRYPQIHHFILYISLSVSDQTYCYSTIGRGLICQTKVVWGSRPSGSGSHILTSNSIVATVLDYTEKQELSAVSKACSYQADSAHLG